ncbi:MAG: SoxR reducing system RseC family protein [Desulfuromonadales bacterium]|nr:SoxR reducing system RseC family protein [Desulfuromonadales bacterium]
MIEEVGTIVELKGKHSAMVMCQKSTLCDNCASSGGCAIGEDDRTRTIEAHNSLGAQVGDKVRIVTSTRTFLQSSFVLYIVPLIALVIGAIAGKLLGENLDTPLSPDLLSAIFGVFFMSGSFVVIRVGSNALKRELYMPKIAEIVREDG